ncbi:protocatechuate 3 [Colletotrichum paranaense]|nr:protocatechuate 3 [Colletotrichum costaricense]XP_060352744.1 protocatechuate 3 [Colletotrichum paranaense]KAI3546815.1 protocatechuate 3 [Colletotrichum filicis]KAK0375416.1 protocatechuate 3 [Colletotrichum limetticola]KAK1707863.1 Intradiol ring-cleavage dioxygenase [Colletotrichum lupini]KAK1515233.1 protocatechuate 3 [Colletotrichum costaricense]KAK1543624.1 protocatechuate 3 [Colletotrichum paranaense]
MLFTDLFLFALAAGTTLAHPEKLTAEQAKHEAKLIGRSTDKCAAAIEKRKAEMFAKRAARLQTRRIQNGHVDTRDLMSRNSLQYTTIQNDTCVLAPDTVWGPYGVDGEIHRHDLRETQGGIDFYLDMGVIDIETCEPLVGTALTIWNCNATGSYSSFTGIDPNTAELLDNWSKRTDGTTDDETFLRGIQTTDQNGVVEFLTKFPGYYITRTTHIHVTAQTNIANGTSYSASKVQHIGQLFFEEDLLSQVYAVSPYSEHLTTLNRTTNEEDSLYSDASADGYSAVISVSQLTDNIEDGLVGYITIGVNSTADGLAITGGGVNPQGYLPTVSVDDAKLAQATAVDRADGYTS